MEVMDKIIDLIDEISLSSPSDEQDYSQFDELKILTRNIWSRYHADLIMELGKKNRPIGDIDYQIFWYECLGFPPQMPLFRDHSGNILDCYGYLQSDFNESCGFGD